jgi:hypothetical protein
MPSRVSANVIEPSGATDVLIGTAVNCPSATEPVAVALDGDGMSARPWTSVD